MRHGPAGDVAGRQSVGKRAFAQLPRGVASAAAKVGLRLARQCRSNRPNPKLQAGHRAGGGMNNLVMSSSASTERMNVLHVLPYRSIGGAEVEVGRASCQGRGR